MLLSALLSKNILTSYSNVSVGIPLEADPEMSGSLVCAGGHCWAVEEQMKKEGSHKGCIGKGSSIRGQLGLNPTEEHWEILQNTHRLRRVGAEVLIYQLSSVSG